MPTIVRIIVRQHGFEIRAFAVAAGLALAAAVGLTIVVASLDLPACLTAAAETAACKAAEARLGDLQLPALVLDYGSAALVALAGLVLGIQTVAKEIDRGTTLIVWTMTPSRWRWMLERVAVLGGIVLVLSGLVGVALDALHQVSYPLTPLSASLADYQARGWMIVAHAVVAYGIGLILGAIVGRPLQALIVGVALTIAVVAGLTWLGDGTAKSSLSLIDGSDSGALVVDFRYRDESGRVMTFDEAAALIPPDDPRFGLQFSTVAIGVPGSQSIPIIAGQALASGLIAAAFTMAAGAITDRRRPY